MSVFLLADIGGSNTRLALYTEEGTLIFKNSFPTPATKGPDYFLDYFKKEVDQSFASLNLSYSNLSGLGLCVAGFYQHDKGIVLHSPNLPRWDNYPLEEKVKKHLGIKPIIENDANGAAFGEYTYTLGKKPKNLIYVTISTGIGSGLIINGEIFRGDNGFAGELGHLKVKENGAKCSCGGRGCLEQVASGEAITLITKKKLLETKQESFLRGKNVLNTKDVFQGAKNGDPVALSVINESIYYLAIGLSHYINLIAPGYLILGGGVMREYNYLSPLLFNHLARLVIKPALQSLTIQKAGLGNYSGLFGMLALIKERITHPTK